MVKQSGAVADMVTEMLGTQTLGTQTLGTQALVTEMRSGVGATTRKGFGGAYDGAKVMITGHTGFKGTWLSLWLLRLGASVTGFASAPPTLPSLFDDCRMTDDLRHVVGDVTDTEAVYRLMNEVRPDIVFHLAAQPIVLASYLDPLGTFATNVMGTASVLDAVRRTGSTRATVIVTTDKCYETSPTAPPHTEADRVGGRDPYSASKACAELVTNAFRTSYDLPASGQGVATTRAGNIVGGGDWAASRILPDCARSLTTGAPLRLRHPQAVRPWQHVLDALAGYLQLGAQLFEQPLAYSEAWNFGPDPTQPFTVADAIDTFGAACARLDLAAGRIGAVPISVQGERRSTPFEEPSLRLDTEKARTRLAWEPILDFTTAVEWAAEWYWCHRFAPHFDARETTIDHIRAYERQAMIREAVWA